MLSSPGTWYRHSYFKKKKQIPQHGIFSHVRIFMIPVTPNLVSNT